MSKDLWRVVCSWCFLAGLALGAFLDSVAR